MCIKCCVSCCLLALACLSIGVLDAQEVPADEAPVGMTGDVFVEALAERLELDWNPCPGTLDEKVRNLDDLRCAVIGNGNVRVEAERLGLMQARIGGKVLDVEYDDQFPDHRYVTKILTFRMENGEPVRVSTRPIYDRLDYLLTEQRVSMWIQRQAEPLVEGGEPERWIAIRVAALEGPFPDFIPAASPSRR